MERWKRWCCSEVALIHDCIQKKEKKIKNYLAIVCLLFASNVQAHSLGRLLQGLRNGGPQLDKFKVRAFDYYLFGRGIQMIREVNPQLAREIDGVIGVSILGRGIPRDTVERLVGELENISNARNKNKEEVLKFLDRSSDSEAKVIAEDIRAGRLVLIPSETVRLALKKDVYSRDEILEFFASRSEAEGGYIPVLTEEGKIFMLSTPEGYERLQNSLELRDILENRNYSDGGWA